MLDTIRLLFALAGLVLYTVLGGADFGAGLWQLLSGRGPAGPGDPRSRPPRDGPGVGGQPRLADLRHSLSPGPRSRSPSARSRPR